MNKIILFENSEIYIYGKCNCCDNIDFISKQLLIHKCWEPNLSSIILEILQKKNNNILFDIGSNIGYFSLISSKYCDKIYSFDANINNLNLLKNSIKINNYENITPINCCICSDENLFYKTSIIHEHNIGSMKVIQCDKDESNIENINLDNFIQKNNINNIDVMKIDIEGSELNCLYGLTNTLKTNIIKNIIIEITPAWSIDESINILTILKNNNYNLYNLGLDECGKFMNNTNLNNLNIINDIHEFIKIINIQTNILAIKILL